MLVGILCECAYRVAAQEKYKLNYQYVTATMDSVIRENIDTDGDMRISKREFLDILRDNKAMRALHKVEVDVFTLLDNADFIFNQIDAEGNEYEKELTFDEFMTVIIDLRAGNFATVKDITNLRKFIKDAADKGELRSHKSSRAASQRSSPGRRAARSP